MTILLFLAGWVLRSSILILCGAGLLWLLRILWRVNDASIRLTAWTALLAGSLAIPALTSVLPAVPIAIMQADSRPTPHETLVVSESLPEPAHAGAAPRQPARPRPDGSTIAAAVYFVVSLIFLFRLLVGLALSRRLLRSSLATDRSFRESERVSAPVTLGIVRPVVILPRDWREWDKAKLEAVLAHERSHIRRHDPAVQLLSAIHRALLWISPLSWFLHRNIVRTAEEASDDAAVAVTRDRALYAEVLLGFMERGIRGVNWLGVPMARYGRADRRIQRILDGATWSKGVTRLAVAATLALALPLAYFVAAVKPSQAAPQVQARPQSQPAPQPPGRKTSPPATVQSPPPTKPRRAPDYLSGLGTVTATTVNVTARVDGQLTSMGFSEGGPVETGQLLASIDPPQVRFEADRAADRLSRDRGQPTDVIRTDQALVAEAQRQLAYAQVHSPLSGVAGLRKIDPGNFVHAGETLVVITQLQPIAVVFSMPEDTLPAVQALLRSSAGVVVEVWNRDNSAKLATGHLAAIDNEIDVEKGTVRLKASFDNKDGALFPNQFVNARVFLKSR